MQEKKIKIVVLDGFVANSGDLSWAGLESLGDLTVYPRTAPVEVVERCLGAEAVYTNKVVIGAKEMDCLPDLKFISVLATGYNVVDINAAAERGITVCNVPAYSTAAVAQMTFALLLSVTNRVADYYAGVARGDWQHCEDFSYRLAPISELSGKTMGIYGFGAIGRAVGNIAHAFGMKVISPTRKDSSVLPSYLEKVELEEMFRRSDVLSLHAPLTPETACIINKDSLAMMKPGAILINTARGGLVDEQALADALNAGHISAAAVDVLVQEPPREGSPLFSAKNAFITPHIAWESNEARKRLLEISAENLKMFLAGSVQNKVN